MSSFILTKGHDLLIKKTFYILNGHVVQYPLFPCGQSASRINQIERSQSQWCVHVLPRLSLQLMTDFAFSYSFLLTSFTRCSHHDPLYNNTGLLEAKNNLNLKVLQATCVEIPARRYNCLTFFVCVKMKSQKI